MIDPATAERVRAIVAEREGREAEPGYWDEDGGAVEIDLSCIESHLTDLEEFRRVLHSAPYFMTCEKFDYQRRIGVNVLSRAAAAYGELLDVVPVRYPRGSSGFELLAEGEPADKRCATSVVMPVLGSDQRLADFVAWPVHNPGFFRLKFDYADGLGLWLLGGDRARSPTIPVFSTPEQWLTNAFAGVCMLRDDAIKRWLVDRRLVAFDDALGIKLSRLLDSVSQADPLKTISVRNGR